MVHGKGKQRLRFAQRSALHSHWAGLSRMVYLQIGLGEGRLAALLSNVALRTEVGNRLILLKNGGSLTQRVMRR